MAAKVSKKFSALRKTAGKTAGKVTRITKSHSH